MRFRFVINIHRRRHRSRVPLIVPRRTAHRCVVGAAETRILVVIIATARRSASSCVARATVNARWMRASMRGDSLAGGLVFES